ncbi:anti-sigma factor [Nocardioides sp. CCNWLW239]|uniref:anti-sigma factor n=1 Tax=Nocardioides sp. CCNWLW239 TaxID=3128902 RepID=UPI003017741D
MNAQDIHALSGAYAVDALDDIERARFEQHLAVCADCRAEVVSLRESAGLLGALTDVAPPPEMRDRLLAGIKEIRPLPPETTEPTESRETYVRRPRWRLIAAAAATLAVIGTGTVAAIELTRDDSSQTVSVADRVLSAEDATTVSVDLPRGAQARVVRSVSEGKAVLVTSDMPPAPDGKVYELWLQHDDVMVPAGLMPDDSDQTFVLEGDAADASAAGITVEPDGGSEEPTSAPIALFDFSQAT